MRLQEQQLAQQLLPVLVSSRPARLAVTAMTTAVSHLTVTSVRLCFTAAASVGVSVVAAALVLLEA